MKKTTCLLALLFSLSSAAQWDASNRDEETNNNAQPAAKATQITTTPGVRSSVAPLIGDPQYLSPQWAGSVYVGYMKWYQGTSPFNDLCPEIEGKKSAVGCVAMSMAMVMSAHKWPKRGEGKAEYLWRGQTLTASFDHEYDWSQMLYRYYLPETTESQRNFIATLLRDCGYATHMNYGVDYTGSGTPEENACKALCNYFHYDRSVAYLCRDYCTTQYWEDMLRREIDAGRPVMYGGGSAYGAHEFTCDGYDDQGRFFFHMGATGVDNYYATLSEDLVYTTSQTAIFRIIPEGDQAATGKETMLAGSNKNFFWEEGRRISANVRFFTPIKQFDAELAVAVENTTTGNISYEKSRTLTTSTINNQGTTVTDFELEGNYPNGTYYVYPVYREQGATAWEKVLFGEYCQDRVTLRVADGVHTLSNEHLKEHIDPGKVKVNGIVYILDETNRTAAVSYQNNSFNSYRGDVQIPETFDYEGQTYRVTSIDRQAFSQCTNLNSIVVPASVESIAFGAFYSCKAKSITFAPQSRLRSIATYAFAYSGFQRIELPEGLTTIGSEAFVASGLVEVVLPATVTSLGGSVFSACITLERFICHAATPPTCSLASNPFVQTEHVMGWKTLYVPEGSAQAYRNHEVWSLFGSIEEGESPRTDPEPEEVDYVYSISLESHPDLYFTTVAAKDNSFWTYSLQNTPEYFRLVENEGGITLQSTRTGQFVGCSRGRDFWNFADEPDTWFIEDIAAPTTVLLPDGKGFGWDGTIEAGKALYTNKTGIKWVFKPQPYEGETLTLLVNMVRRTLQGKCQKWEVESVLDALLHSKTKTKSARRQSIRR
ncbi:MAG: C10 family peptidase [Bacteroidales bacterium]|nr:C10 family peptidase [Candidatus Physcousia equi]